MSNWWDDAPVQGGGKQWWEAAPPVAPAPVAAEEGIGAQLKRRADEALDRGVVDTLKLAPAASLELGQSTLRGLESGLYGLGGTAAFLGGVPLARLGDLLTGDRFGLTDRAAGVTRDYFDAATGAMRSVSPDIEDQAAAGAGKVALDLGTAMLTRGGAMEARALTAPLVERSVAQVARQAAEQAIEGGARASIIPSLTRGSQLATDVLDAGGTVSEAAGAGAAGATANTLAYMMPGAAAGSLPSRLLQGAAAEVPAGYLQQQAENLALPDRLGLDQAYGAREAFMDALLGGGLAGMTGARQGPAFADPDAMRGRQAIEYDAVAPVDDSWFADALVVEPAPAPAPVAAAAPPAAEPASPPAAPVEAVPAEAPARSAGPTQQVFHGSRRTGLDRIQLDRSGTGSGEANYGFGAYFASNREGADAIRQGTSSIARIPGGRVADAALTEAGGDRGRAAATLRRQRQFAPSARQAEIDQAIEVLRREPNRGTTYATQIPADSTLLSWDEPLSAQPAPVQEALAGLGFTDPDMPGSRIYRELTAREGGQRQASDALSAAGVPGNRYRDGRGGQHYVVWDEAQVAPLVDADAPAPVASVQAPPPVTPQAEAQASPPVEAAPSSDARWTRNEPPAPDAGSRNNPLPHSREADAPLGAWVSGPVIPGVSPEESVRQIRDVSISEIDATEFDSAGRIAPEKRGDAERYAEMLRGGSAPPNARGSELPNGRIKLQDGHRRLKAAADSGATTLRMAVSPMPESASAPSTAATPPAAPPPTSTKNRVTEAERTAEGRDPIVREMRRSNEETVSRAREALAENPRLVDEIVARDPSAPISSTEEAAMLLQKVQERNRRDEASRTLADPSATESQRTAARRAWDDAEAKIGEIDAANVARGREWGRFGQFRQRLMAADFSLEAMESKLRRAKGAPLTSEETADLRALADRLKKADADLVEARRQIAEFEQNQIVRSTIEQAIREAMGQVRADKKAGKPKLEALRERAEAARKSLAATESVPSRRGQSGAVISPAVFVDLYHIGAYHVANGAVKLVDWVKAMTADLGEKFTTLERYWPEIFAAAKAENAAYDTAGRRQPRTAEQVVASIDPANVTRDDVRDLVMARIRAGERDADAIMRAVTADVQSVAPEATEADVRQLFADYGKRASPTRDEDRRTLAAVRTIIGLQNEIARLEGGGQARTASAKQAASEEVRQLRSRLGELLKRARDADPAVTEALQQARAENLQRRIADLEDMIATGRRPAPRGTRAEPSPEVASLEARRDELIREMRSIDRPRVDPETRYQRTRARTLASEAERIRERMATGDYARRPRVPKALSETNKAAAFELDKLRREFRLKQFQEELKQRSRVSRYLDNTASGINLARAVMTSFDLSGLLRQGGFITLGHPVRGAMGIPDMLKAFVSERAAHAVQEDIENRPNAPIYKKAGLQITSDDGSLSKMEEAYMTRWLERIQYKDGQPIRNAGRKALNVVGAPIRGSARAYTTFLNKLRADSFDAMAAALSKDGEPTDAEAKALANYINVATGRGKVPGMSDAAAAGLNTVFFAPKLVASRFQLLSGQPLYGGSARTRAMIAKEYARYMAGLGVVYALGNLARLARDPEDEDERRPFIEMDPRSSSFGRMRFGDWFVDPLSGLAQVSTILARSVGGETKTAKGDIKPMRDNYRLSNGLYEAGDMLDRAGFEGLAGAFPEAPNYEKLGIADQTVAGAIGSFMRTKLAPVPGAVVNTLTAENMIGQPTTPGQEAVGLVTPMTFGNVADAIRDQGVATGTALTLAEILGMGVQFRDRAAFDAPDYANMDFGRKREYSNYLQRVQNMQQDVNELRRLARSFPDDTPPGDVRDAVQAAAESMGLEGVDLAQYKRKTTARDDRGVRKQGLKRTDSGNVEMEFADGGNVRLMLDTEEAVNKINRQIEDMIRAPMTDEELDKLYQKYFPGESASGDKAVVARALADERDRAVNHFMEVVGED